MIFSNILINYLKKMYIIIIIYKYYAFILKKCQLKNRNVGKR
jgi:hypothetical protein